MSMIFFLVCMKGRGLFQALLAGKSDTEDLDTIERLYNTTEY